MLQGILKFTGAVQALFAAGVLLHSPLASGAVFVTQSVTGFNADVVAQPGFTAVASTSTPFDNLRVFYAQGFAVEGGLPTDGHIVSASSGNDYQLASYSANNVLRLPSNGSAGTLSLAAPANFSQVGLLATSAHGTSTVDYSLNFDNGLSQLGTLSVFDWFNTSGSGAAITGLGRVTRNEAQTIDGTPDNPRLFEFIVEVDPAFQSANLLSITFTNISTAGAFHTPTPGIFAVSAIPEPSAYAFAAGLVAILVLLRRRR